MIDLHLGQVDTVSDSLSQFMPEHHGAASSCNSDFAVGQHGSPLDDWVCPRLAS